MAAVVEIPLAQLPAEIGRAIASMSKVRFAPVGKVLEQLAVSDTKKRFNAGVSPEGRPWVPLRHQRTSSKGADKPLRDFGLLMASVQAKATQTDLTVSSNLIYAGLHQFGGVVKPRRGKFLAIPATKEARRAGGARRFPKPLSPRINKRGTGGVLIDANDTVQYFLTKSVTVPARPFLGFSKELIGYVQEVLTDAAIAQFTFGTKPGMPAPGIPTRARAA